MRRVRNLFHAMATIAVMVVAAHDVGAEDLVLCSASSGAPHHLALGVTIRLPDETSSSLEVAGMDVEQGAAGQLANWVGLGRIQVIVQTADNRARLVNAEYKFVVTQPPIKRQKLLGFYFAPPSPNPYLVEADVWSDEKRFRLTSGDGQYVGQCRSLERNWPDPLVP